MTAPITRPQPDIARAESAVAKIASAFPETREDNPWGHRAFKVRGKTFLFLVADGEGLSISVKLPESGTLALELPFTEPTGYGLGKSGWVSARFKPGTPVPIDMIGEWLHESYAAIAPKKLSASLGERIAAPAPRSPKASVKRAAKISPKSRPMAKTRTPAKVEPSATVKRPPAKVKAKTNARSRKSVAPARATASRRRK